MHHNFVSNSNQDSRDLSLSNISLMTNSIDRHSILNGQYFLEKRGKTFGSKEYRKFCIREGKPYQVSLNQFQPQFKQLPIPINIITQFRTGSKIWNEQCRDHLIRLYLQFANRSPVYVYFRNTLVSEEIRMYLLSLAFKRDNIDLCKFSMPFKSVIVQKVIDKIKFMAAKTPKTQKPLTGYYDQAKMKAVFRLTNQIELHDPVYQLMNQWATKAQSQKDVLVDTLRIKVESVKSPLQLKLANISIKLWIMAESRQLASVVKQSDQRDHSIFVPAQNNFTEIAGCNMNNQFQFEISEGLKKWKSQRMKIIDLLRVGRKTIRIPLSSTQPYPSVLIQLSLSSELEERFFVKDKLIELTPINYSVIEEMIGSDYNQNIKINYDLHLAAVQQHSQKDSQQIQFFRLKRYIQSLQIENMIQKCYANQPALKNFGTQHRGTVIYKYYANITKNIRYYDVQKILLQHGNFHQRRFYNSLKRFDNALRINFSSKLYYLIDKIFKLVETSPSVYWSSELFEYTYFGRQSAVFFIVIVIIFDIAPNYLLIGNKGLAPNSLLLHYTTKIHLNTLYNKLSLLEINIETLFGIYSASLLAELIEGEGYYKVLDAFILESKSKKYQFNLTMIGLFLSLLSRMQKYESMFQTADNFIFGLKLISLHINDQQQFCYGGDLFIQKMKKIINDQQFTQINNQMKQFYKEEQNGIDLPSTMIEFFTQFPENQQKIQKTYRELHFCINKIEINTQCPKLTLYMFQNKVRIFEKEISNQPLRQLHTNFGITLDSLNQIIIAVYQDQKIYTQFCQINPRKIPSNYMFQLCLPIERSKKGLLDESPCFICFQVVIKQQTSSVVTQPIIPAKYSEFFFDAETYKKQISNINNFASLFKMSPNNYNSLYSKLGWYNNHYVVPAEQLISVHRLQSNDILELPDSDANYYYHMNKYSRCAFGRAIVCSRDKSLFIQSIKNGIRFGMVHKFDLQKSKGSVSSQLACYALENVKAFNPTYLQFFLNAMELPLIDYLTYNPLQYDVLPDLVFDLFLGDIKSTVILSSQAEDDFVIFSETDAIEIQNTITYRKLRLRSKYVLKFPNSRLSMDNFMYHLRLNIFSSVIRTESADNRVLTKWPSHIIIKANQLVTPLANMPLFKFLVLIYQTKYTIVMEFADQGKPREKQVNALAFIKCYDQWKSVQVLCEINSIYKYYLIEDQVTRKKFIVKETQVISLTEFPKIKISCDEAELQDQASQLYKKIQKLF